MKARDVFTPGSSPTVTFVSRHLEDRKDILRDALEQGGILVNISGPSKSGKTVFVRSLLGPENMLPITGAGANSPADLWEKVFHLIGTEIPSGESRQSTTGITLDASLKTSGNIFVAKAEGTGGISGSFGDSSASTFRKAGNHLQTLISELRDTDFVIFIDDFHYIPKDVQKDVAAEIKEAIANGVRIVCASVPHHSEDVLRANPDLRGRIVTIDFDYWEPDTLTEIAEKGFSELNTRASVLLVREFAGEAAGSPQLMQSICLNACFEAGIRERAEQVKTLDADRLFIEKVCVRSSLGADYSSTMERLRDGPRVRGSERRQYRLRGGDVGDVYSIILRALALDPPRLHFRYAELQSRIRQVCEGESPSGSSVSGACAHIAAIASAGSDRPIIEWDGTEDALSLRDPYLLFYMRWSVSNTH